MRQNGLLGELGYMRVSTSSRDAQLQLDALVSDGVQKRDVFAEGAVLEEACPGAARILAVCFPPNVP